MFRRRNEPGPAPRPAPVPAPANDLPEVDEPVPVVDDPEVVTGLEEPAAERETELPAWAQPFEADEERSLPTGRELIEGWEQTSKGNCVTVAAIKAAQKVFGAQLANSEDPSLGVFARALASEDGGMDVLMRDGFELSLSPDELAAAAQSSRFKTDVGREDLLDNANKLYAAAAKRAQIEGNDGIGPNQMSYLRALQSLEDGEHTANIMEQVGRLGLKDHAKKVPRTELRHHDATLSSGAGHAYFVSNGERDYYGKVGPLNSATTGASRRGRRARFARNPPHSAWGTVLQRQKLVP
ncbi:MAG: hypothetical protein EP330_14040 [Deltaproteobacteria bacterium]|nr:MAG: hypothetical protein EP330_14040 [Deltaproteobacteria bacterium]